MIIQQKRVAAFLALPALMTLSAGPALADTLYKSIAANGKITYSDRPQPAAVSVEPIHTVYEPNTVKPSRAPEVYPERGGNSKVKLATAALDAAERALAIARQPLLANHRGLLNAAGLRANVVDFNDIEYFKDQVARARLELAQALQLRTVRYAARAVRPVEATLKTAATEAVKPSLYSFNGLEYPVNSR